ncbi:DUF1697 domain-containing protein [Mesorhizobium yinganensis]|uniref:DUF1697 domain-containing protein n=1 Tax=Mesorhizobium yinganensis TaxID=3157707 RepID=UPI0032B7B36B
MTGKTVFILLFRGVGGATQLPTGPLREALAEAGFENVATYINSGNAVVRTKLSREKTVAKVAEICREKFGFTKTIHAPAQQEWSKLIADNPFPDAVSVPKFLHAAVLEKAPQDKNVAAIRAYAKEGEKIEIVGKVAYLHTPAGFGTSKMAERFDKLIGVENTARNWNSVLKLEELAKKAAKG